jgi:hypothetical protein
MMFLFGIISIFQICVLPGLLLLKATHYSFSSWIESLSVLLASSLLINYFCVFLLTALHTYTKPVLLCVIIGECIVTAYVYRSHIIRWLKQPVALSTHKTIPIKNSWIFVLLGVALAVCFYPVFLVFFQNIPTVFTGWDPAIAWNRWAIIWSQNMMPQNIGHYPQVLSTNWSISYVLMGMPIEFFPKAITGLFWLYTICILFNLSINHKPLRYITALFVVLYLFAPYMAIVTSGYAEVAVGFFWILGIYALIQFLSTENKQRALWYLYAISFTLIGSALVKQTGIYTIAAFPILLLTIRKKLYAMTTKKQRMVFYLCSGLFFVCGVIPFYYLAQYWIRLNINGSEIHTILFTMHNHRNFYERFLYAIGLLTHDFPTPILIILGISSLLSLKNSFSRKLFFVFVLPYSIIWAEFFSYEVRLLLPVIPLFAITVGIGLETISAMIYSLKKIQIRHWIILCIALFCIGIPCIVIQDQTLIDQNTMAKMDIGDPEVNHFLFSYNMMHPISKTIFTDYIPLTLFPKFTTITTIGAFTTNADIHGYLTQITDPNTKYILIPTQADSRLLDDIQKRVENGTFIIEKKMTNYLFIRIVGR